MSKTRTALITGAAGGIGQATAEAFWKDGWTTIAVDRAAIRTTCDLAIRADLAKEKDIERVARRVEAAGLRLDALINNAALQLAKPLIATSAKEWDALTAVNVRAIYLLMSRFHQQLLGSKGAIVNISSVHAIATSKGMAAYVASKGAVVALTRATALEFAPDIRVNAVLPGAIETPMLTAGLKRDGMSLKSLAGRHPLERVGKPEEVAQAILFLADGTRSSFITGQTLVVDGGATARLGTE